MLVFSKHESRRYKEYLAVLVISYVLHLVRSIDFIYALGCVLAVVIAVEFISLVLGLLLTPIMYEQVYPTKIRELKHSDGKHYQYIAEINGKEIYSEVFYKQPMDGLNIKVWKFHSAYLFEVKKATPQTGDSPAEKK